MKSKVKAFLHSIALACLLLVAVAACGSDSGQPDSTLEVESGRNPNEWVTGTVIYRERLALTPGAKLEVALRDVSYADAASPLIARQVIPNPGQVPIEFRVGYNRDDINSRNTYSVTARITESDGRLAFINDTAYDVITRSNPTKVDMVLVLVEPPPGLVEQTGDSDWRDWVETPVQVISASLIPNEPELLVMVRYYQSTIDGCVRLGKEELRVDGNDLKVTVTLMQPPSTPWAIACDEDLVELETIARTEALLGPGETYRLVVNGHPTTTFSLPEAEFPYSFIAVSHIESANVEVLGSAPPQYQLQVVSGMPKGSGCSRFNGYEIRRANPTGIEVEVTHHEVADPMVGCITDYPTVETLIPLGSDFEPGVEYTVVVNADTTETFEAQ